MDNEISTLCGDGYDGYAASYMPDIVYAHKSGMDLHIQMLMPYCAGPENRLPLLVYVKGSGYFKQNIYGNIAQIAFFAHAGFIVASVEHRPSGIAKSPAFLVDVKQAIRFLRCNAERYHIDPERIAIVGDSSGGHTAMLVGLTAQETGFDEGEHLQYASGVNAVIDLYGVVSLLKMADVPRTILHDETGLTPEQSLFGMEDFEKYLPDIERIDALNYISKGKPIPPFLILHGTQDDIVPISQSYLLYEALKDAKARVQMYEVAGAGHGRRFYSEKLMQIMVDFLKKHL